MVQCSLCGCTQPTTVHVLGGCPSSLKQGRFTYRHNQVLHYLTVELTKVISEVGIISVYADLTGMCVSDSPQATISPSLLITSYCPDTVFYNESSNSVALLELTSVTCPLDSVEHLKSARDRKQGKREYQELQSEFDRQRIPCFYDTIEISVLSH